MGVSSSLEPSISLIQAGKPYVGSLLPQTNSLDGELLPLLYYCWWESRLPLGVSSIWPIFVEQDDNLFDSSKRISPPVVSALSDVLRCVPSVPSIIITDIQEIVVFTPAQAGDSYAGNYERVKTTEFSLALRVITAAYLDDELPARVFLNCPDVDNGIDTDLVFPEGPQQDPSPHALPTDQTVFTTCHRHSDFDIPTLVRDPKRVSQFFRWKEHVRSHHSKIVAHFNDILTGVTNEIGMQLEPFPRPLFPLELSDIPRETMSHLEEIQRESPLVTAGIADVLEKSKRFSLKIQDIIAKGTGHGFCTVYRCEITSIDDQPIMWCPPLCLKLFDDRFQSLSMPEPQPTFGFKNVDGQLQSFFIPDKRDSDEFLHHLFYCMSFGGLCPQRKPRISKIATSTRKYRSLVLWYTSSELRSLTMRLIYISMVPSSHCLMGLYCMVSWWNTLMDKPWTMRCFDS